MRVVVTGHSNATGQAIVHALLGAGHHVRLFGGEPDAAAAFAGEGECHWHPGQIEVAGSIEPVLSEREVLIHAACLDVYDHKPDDRHAAAVAIERGTLYARYGAEREQVGLFVHVAPAMARGDRFHVVQAKAVAHVEGMRGPIRWEVVAAQADPAATAAQVLSLLSGSSIPGKQPGRETDAVTV